MDEDGAAGCAGCPVRSEGREGEPGRIALGCHGIVIGVRLEEKFRSPACCKAVVLGRDGVGFLVEDEGDIGLGIVADEGGDDCGSCITLFAIIGLTSLKLVVRGSRLVVLEFRGDPACSGTLEEILVSRLAEGSGDRERERECLLCLEYPESRRYPGL